MRIYADLTAKRSEFGILVLGFGICSSLSWLEKFFYGRIPDAELRSGRHKFAFGFATVLWEKSPLVFNHCLKLIEHMLI